MKEKEYLKKIDEQFDKMLLLGKLQGELHLWSKMLNYYTDYIEPLEKEHFMYKAGWLDCIKKMKEHCGTEKLKNAVNKKLEESNGGIHGSKKTNR